MQRAQAPLRLGAHTYGERDLLVMAIVNRTPDSFYDKGETFALDKAIEKAVRAIEQGADIVDIGGVKAGPGVEVSAQEELDRVGPVVSALRETDGAVVISVDTYRADVAEEVLKLGCNLINDSWGGADPRMAEVVAAYDAALVCSHVGGLAPRTDPHRVRYADVVADVISTCTRLAEDAVSRGVSRESIVIDPCHDFAKNTRHSLEVTRRLNELVDTGWPVLVALSNKDFIGESLDLGRLERVPGTLAATVYSAMQGARLFRAHNVAETRQALDMLAVIEGWQEPKKTLRALA